VGRQLAKGIESQRRLEGGTNARGRNLTAGQVNRLQRRVERGQGAAGFLGENRQFLGGAADRLRRRGLGLEAGSEFARDGEPVEAQGFASGGLDPFTANMGQPLVPSAPAWPAPSSRRRCCRSSRGWPHWATHCVISFCPPISTWPSRRVGCRSASALAPS
jgi:hypothetical protein